MKRGSLTSSSSLKSNASLKSTRPLKATKRKITGRSKKAIAFEVEYQAVRPSIIDRADGMCEIKMICAGYGEAEHVHHAQQGRSHGGSNDPAKLFAACNACHDWIHSHSKMLLVKKKGWIISGRRLTTTRKDGTV